MRHWPRLVACVVPCALAISASAATPPLPPPARAAIVKADSLLRARRPEAGFAILDSLIRASSRPGGEVVRMRASATKGASLAFTGQSRAAEAPLLDAVRLARQIGDSTTYAESARWLAWAWIGAARLGDADSLYAEALPVADAAGAKRAAAYMRLGRAYVTLQTGRPREALPRYREVRQRFAEIGETYGELESETGLGRSFHAIGKLDSAAACYRRVAARARATGQKTSEGHALNNLGVIEHIRGDPARALVAYRAATALIQSAQGSPAAATTASNVALALAGLGRLDEAAAQLDSLVEAAERRGNSHELWWARMVQGQMYVDQDAGAAAARVFRGLLTRGDSVGFERALKARLGLARALLLQDSVAAALAILESAPPAPGGSTAAFDQSEARYARAVALSRLRRYREALEPALRGAGEMDALGWRGTASAWGLAATCAASLGDRKAREHLDRAIERWERMRLATRDLEWLSSFDAVTANLCGAVGDVMYAEGVDRLEVRERAFDTAQRLKARALLDRMHGGTGPDTGASAFVTSRLLQREVLRPGEVFVNFYLGGDSSLVFAISREQIAVASLPGHRQLTRRLGHFRDLLSARPGSNTPGPDAVSAASREVGRLLLGPHREMLRGARRVVISPDGITSALPFEALILPGEKTPINRTREVAYAPSATIWAAARARAATSPRRAPPARLLVLAATRNGSGQPMEGAVSEARDLARRFRGVNFRADVSAEDGERALESDFDAVHVAAHAEVDPQYPWRSGLLLDPGASDAGEGWIRAGRIANLTLRGRLAVLASCATASGRIRRGEGVEGLTAAFLLAGVPTVVSTLWAVDDATTARLMRRFYHHLERGTSAAAALRNARCEIAGERETAAPYYWAAFILSGEPDLKLPLQLRSGGRLGSRH